MQQQQVYLVVEMDISETVPRAAVFVTEIAAEAYATSLVQRHLKTTEDDPATLWEMLADARSGYSVDVLSAPMLVSERPCP